MVLLINQRVRSCLIINQQIACTRSSSSSLWSWLILLPSIQLRSTHHQASRTKPRKILFFGSDGFSCIILNRLLNTPDLCSQIHVITPPISRTGRGLKQIYRPPLLDLADQAGLRFQTLNRPQSGACGDRNPLKDWTLPSEFDHAESSDQPAPILVTASFPYFIPSRLIDRFRPSHGLNVHPSLLPSYRGPAPIQWQIANLEPHSGISIQDLSSKGFDRGNILAQKAVNLPHGIDYLAAESLLAHQAAHTLCEVINDLDRFIISAKPQDDQKATHAPKISQLDLRIDSSWTLERVQARYRAMGHQYPLSIQVKSDRYYVLPEFDDSERIGKLEAKMGMLLTRKAEAKERAGRMIYDRETNLVGVELRGDHRGEILALKAFKLAVAGGKGWIEPLAWSDRILNQLRLQQKPVQPPHAPGSHPLKNLKASKVNPGHIFLDS